MPTDEDKSGSINFEMLEATLNDVNLLESKGSVVRVSGLTVESNGPSVGLGRLCMINLSDGRGVMAEVVAFRVGHLVLLPYPMGGLYFQLDQAQS